MSKRIVIIGAGPAGLTTALELLRQGNHNEVVVLEADKQIGGLAKTIRWGNNRFDVGGHRYFSTDTRVREWWNGILPMPEVRRHSSVYFQQQYLDYPIKFSNDTLNKLGSRLMLQIIWSYLEARVRQSSIESLEGFFISRFGEKLYRLFFHDYTKKVWGKDPSEISPDWGPERIKGISLSEIARTAFAKRSGEPSLTDRFYYPRHGSGELWETVAEEIEKLGGKILVNHTVTQLKRDGDRIVEAFCTTPTGNVSITGDHFISTMPLRDLINCIPNIPAEVVSVANRLSYRDMVVVGVLLDRTRLSQEGSIVLETKDQWIYVQDKDIDFGRIQVVNNWSEEMIEEPDAHLLLVLEYFCQSGDALWMTPDKDWQESIAADLNRIGILQDKSEIIKYDVNRIPKAYPCYWDGYQDIEVMANYLATIHNLICIGRNGKHQYKNMDDIVIDAINLVRSLND